MNMSSLRVHPVSSRFRDNLRDIVFGLEDGMVSTLGVVTGIAIGSENRWIVLLAGVVVIFVESLSMSAGSYLSAKSERESYEREIEEEKQEIRKNKESEMEEWRQFYRDRGLHEDDIQKIEDHYRENEQLLLEDMMHKELGITERTLKSPSDSAVFMLFAYFFGGSMALLGYVFFALPWAIYVSVVVTFLSLFIVGYMKGKVVGIHPGKSGLEMLLISAGAALIGFVVGKVFGAFLPVGVL